jgi:uncharacterized membrane protein YhdT
MSARKRPVSVLILSCLYITVGAVGFAYHFPELIGFKDYAVWIELTELLAILAGAFMLLGPQLGTLARACLDGLPCSDQLPGSSPDGGAFHNFRGDCVASLSS